MRAALLSLLILSLLSPLPAAAKKKPAETSELTLTGLVFSGRFSDAESVLEGLLGKKAKGPWKERLRFIQAYVELHSGDKAKAAKLFGELDPKGPLKDYIVYYRALALRESGQAKEAIPLLTELSSQSLPPNLTAKVSRDLALAYCKTGDRGQAVDRLNALIQTEPSPAKTYRLRFDRARCLLELGDKAEAMAGLLSLYRSEPEGELSGQILAALKEADPEYRVGAGEHIARAELLLERKRPDLAAVDLEEAVRLSAPAPLSLKKQLAQAYYKARRYREAAVLFEEMRADPASGFGGEDDLGDLARSYSRSDQFDSAIAVYRELGVDAENAYKIAFLKMDQGKLEDANQLFVELLAAYPTHPRRASVEWFLAWNNYRLENYAEAEARFGELQAKAAREKSEKRAAYWRARSLEALNRNTEAKAIYSDLADDENLSYYALLSLKRLEKLNEPTQAPRRGAVQSLPRLKVPEPFAMGELDSPGGKESLRRLKELLLVGLWEDFLAELDFVAARESVLEDFSEIRNGTGATAQDSGSWNLKYPPAYATLVTLFTQTRHIPPALAWAIMREESRFRPQVVSPANAIGLMQIIPPTGSEIAAFLRRSAFSPEDLYRPVVNVEYGVQYLAMNLKRFSGNLIETIASYNAGPEAVERWKKARPGRDWQEFVEEIPYAETQDYVRKVLRSYYLYSLIYGLDEKVPAEFYSGK